MIYPGVEAQVSTTYINSSTPNTISFILNGLFARDMPRRNGHSAVLGLEPFLTACLQHRFSQQPRPSTMGKRRDGVLSTLNAAIEVMNLAKEVSSVTPAKAVFGSVSVILTMISVCFPSSDDIFHVHV